MEKHCQKIDKLLLVLFHLFSSIFSGEGIFFRNAARFYFYSFLYYHKRLCFSSPDTGFRIKKHKIHTNKFHSLTQKIPPPRERRDFDMFSF